DRRPHGLYVGRERPTDRNAKRPLRWPQAWAHPHDASGDRGGSGAAVTERSYFPTKSVTHPLTRRLPCPNSSSTLTPWSATAAIGHDGQVAGVTSQGSIRIAVQTSERGRR